MKLINKFKKSYTTLGENKQETKPEVPEGLLKKCNMCKAPIYTDEVIANNYICPKCKSYFRIGPRVRISMVVDKGSFVEMFQNLKNILKRQKSPIYICCKVVQCHLILQNWYVLKK
mgnify:CR=1 FL=1